MCVVFVFVLFFFLILVLLLSLLLLFFFFFFFFFFLLSRGMFRHNIFVIMISWCRISKYMNLGSKHFMCTISCYTMKSFHLLHKIGHKNAALSTNAF